MRASFLRLTDAKDKATALREAAHEWKEEGIARHVHEAEVARFADLPGSPFIYWVSDRVIDILVSGPPFERPGIDLRAGLQTSDDFRFLRLWWEIEPETMGRDRKWVPFAKGGKYSPYCADVHMVLNWGVSGHEIKAWAGSLYGGSHWSRIIKNVDYYFRPGITWPNRPAGAGWFSVVPPGGIFSISGMMAFMDREDILWSTALLNSDVFIGLLHLFMARGVGDSSQTLKYEVGYLGPVPLPVPEPRVKARLATLATSGWERTRALRNTMGDLVFSIPIPATPKTADLEGRIRLSQERKRQEWRDLDEVRQEVNATAFAVYGIGREDAETLRAGLPFGGTAGRSEGPQVDEDACRTNLRELLEWAIGVGFGRFDIRLATGERPIPEAPDPFDPLPVCSPGMLQDEDGLPATSSPPGYPIEVAWDGILVDDEGHPRDIVRHIRRVLSEVSGGQDWAAEAEEILGRDLRSWVQRSLFEDHIKRYSKSRRKAPIFWRLGTSSGSYSVWLYYPRATGDTLYRVLNDYVEPKLRHEESALLRLRQEAGTSPTASQQKRIEAQETLVSEVQDLRGELEDIAQLWRPEFDDGVVLNFAPFWRLVAHTRTWQKECQKHWTKLREGEYDWSYTAIRLWPERVVPACAEDRSFAIAHGLEEEFCPEEAEGDAGGASKVRESQCIQKLVDARSSAAVKQALQTLLER